LEVGISAAPSLAHDLYERYSGQIFGFCVNRLGSREEAEDALQSTFLNAHRALQRGVTPDAELPWLFKIAHNVCLTRRRSTRRRGRVETPSDFESVQDVVPAPPREAREELIELTGALSEMPDSQRRAILLREWQGLSYHEIASKLELSPSAVETLIFRARRTLAANLESRPGLLARARQALDLGGVVTAANALFEGAVALKAAAAAVAVSGAVVVATAPSEHPRPAVVPKAEAEVVRVPARPTARETVVPSASVVATKTPTSTRAAARTPVVAVRPRAQSPVEQPPAAVVPTVTPPVTQTPPESVPSTPAPEPTPAVSAPTAGSDPTPVAAEPAQQLRHQRPDAQQPDPIAAAPSANPGVPAPEPSG
jgi:RNA polymerase sigma factor (sigma-70 family)